MCYLKIISENSKLVSTRLLERCQIPLSGEAIEGQGSGVVGWGVLFFRVLCMVAGGRHISYVQEDCWE